MGRTKEIDCEAVFSPAHDSAGSFYLNNVPKLVTEKEKKIH